jgi:hypothetical protein
MAVLGASSSSLGAWAKDERVGVEFDEGAEGGVDLGFGTDL